MSKSYKKALAVLAALPLAIGSAYGAPCADALNDKKFCVGKPGGEGNAKGGHAQDSFDEIFVFVRGTQKCQDRDD